MLNLFIYIIEPQFILYNTMNYWPSKSALLLARKRQKTLKLYSNTTDYSQTGSVYWAPYLACPRTDAPTQSSLRFYLLVFLLQTHLIV